MSIPTDQISNRLSRLGSSHDSDVPNLKSNIGGGRQRSVTFDDRLKDRVLSTIDLPSQPLSRNSESASTVLLRPHPPQPQSAPSLQGRVRTAASKGAVLGAMGGVGTAGGLIATTGMGIVGGGAAATVGKFLLTGAGIGTAIGGPVGAAIGAFVGTVVGALVVAGIGGAVGGLIGKLKSNSPSLEQLLQSRNQLDDFDRQLKRHLTRPLPSPDQAGELKTWLDRQQNLIKIARAIRDLVPPDDSLYHQVDNMLETADLVQQALAKDKQLTELKTRLQRSDPQATEIRHDTERGSVRLYSFSEIGATVGEAIALVRSGIEPSPAVRIGSYDTLTGPKQFIDDNETGISEKFGAGGLNTLARIRYQGGKDVVFQQASEESAIDTEVPKAQASGIDRNQPRFPHRAVATSILADRLKTDNRSLVPETRFGLHKGQLGMMMDIAPGKALLSERDIAMNAQSKMPGEASTLKDWLEHYASAGTETIEQLALTKGMKLDLVYTDDNRIDTDNSTAVYTQQRGYNINLDHPTLQRQLNQLQLLDFLTGQIDRHIGNYFIDNDPNTRQIIGLSAIDNDLAFGKNLTTVEQYTLKSYQWTVGLPPVVDRDFANSLLSLTADQLASDVGDLLTADEMSALNDRLDILKSHIRNLPDQNLIESDRWGPETARLQNNPRTSYYAREKQALTRSFNPDNGTLLPMFAGKQPFHKLGVSI